MPEILMKRVVLSKRIIGPLIGVATLSAAALSTPPAVYAQSSSVPPIHWQERQHGHGRPATQGRPSAHDRYWPDQPNCPRQSIPQRVGSQAWVDTLRRCRHIVQSGKVPGR